MNMSIEYFISYKYYTMQTNIMVTLWWTLAIIWHKKPEKRQKISAFKGAFTLYITVTFIIFAILLSGLYQPTGYAAFTNLILHYITPIAFILDYLVIETKTKYEWKYLIYWILYPLAYLIFAQINGALTGNYLYYFLDVDALGIPILILAVGFLVIFFLALGIIYLIVNRKRGRV